MNNDYSICMPAHIVEYFAETQTATVQIAMERVFSTSNEDDQLKTREKLYEVPVYTSGGGHWHITFPIKAGDPCLLHFSQFGYDHWLFKNESEAGIRTDKEPKTWTKRKFSLDDGFCQVGWNNLPTAIADYNPTDAEFRNVDRDQRVSLLEDGQIHIKTGSTTINLTKDGDIDINTDTNVTATVGGNMTANVTGDTVVNCANANVTAQASTTLTSPTVDIVAATGVTMITPLVTMTGNLLLGGALGSGGAGVPASGAVIDGPIESTNTMTATDVISGGKSVNGHTHSNPEGGNTGGF